MCFPLLDQCACSLRVCHMFASCLQRVYYKFTTCFPLLGHTACPPHVCNILSACLPRVFPFWPMLCVRRVFATCLPRFSPSGLSEAYSACSPHVCNVFDTCLGNLTPIKVMF